jgi:hypothetical protein
MLHRAIEVRTEGQSALKPSPVYAGSLRIKPFPAPAVSDRTTLQKAAKLNKLLRKSAKDKPKSPFRFLVFKKRTKAHRQTGRHAHERYV